MNYNLNLLSQKSESAGGFSTLKKLLKLIEEERPKVIKAMVVIFFNSLLSLIAPLIIGITIDRYIKTKDYHGVLVNSGGLLLIYLASLFTSYQQTKLMGGIGQRLLFALRNSLFFKLQQLPVAFFNDNKAGDLISRLNNDTDKINQFFSQALIQFISSIVGMTGAAIFLIAINWKLGLVTLLPGLFIFLFTRLVSPWVKKKNAANLQSTGALSGEIQESLNNFKLIIAFNRRDYFRDKFEKVNQQNYKTALSSGMANSMFLPVYSLIASVAQLFILIYGIYLIAHGQFTVGLMVSFLAYANNFYFPLRQLATLWASFQMAMAGWDRIAQILEMKNNLEISDINISHDAPHLISFRDVSFSYSESKEVLHHINFEIEAGKTYAFVGPTGGGKTTTASLIARLYDPSAGEVLFKGKNMRGYSADERTDKIGFILQDPILFSGTVGENIVYGNKIFESYEKEKVSLFIKEKGLDELITIFDKGLDTVVGVSGGELSIGQKQLIAFIRAVLREPELLILDEATANIDTVTEKLLQDTLNKLPSGTSKVIIAHRLNTIQDADEIFFVNAGEVIKAGSFSNALELLLHNKNVS